MSEVSAFGAELGSPAQAAAVLRARAAAAGVALASASPVDMVAGVLGAHCWAVAVGRERLSGAIPSQHAASLAAALVRASGHGGVLDPDLLAWRPDVPPLPATTLARITPVVEWAVKEAGREAVHLAAQDLAGATDVRVAAVAGFLAEWLDSE